MQGLDRHALLWVVRHRTGWLDPVFVGLSVAGYGGLLWIGLAAGLAAWRRRGVLAFLHGTLGASFPSGHAAMSFAGATFLALAAPRLAPALFVLAAAVAYSRVYVGVHYPLDVVAGAALGAAVGVGFRVLGPRAGALLQAGPLRRPG